MIEKITNCIPKKYPPYEVYGFDDLTLQELLCEFFKKINECVDLSNEAMNFLEWLKEYGVSEEITNILNQWLEDGTIENLINVDKINNLKAELIELINKLEEDLTNHKIENNEDIFNINVELENIKENIDTNENNINSNTEKIEELNNKLENLEHIENDLNELINHVSKRDTTYFEELPFNFEGLTNVNGSMVAKNNVIKRNDFIFIIFTDSNLNCVIAKKTIDTDTWESYNLASISGNPFNLPITENGHCYFSFEIDSDGYIHIIGNCHATNIRYCISNIPYSINSFSTSTMVGNDENLFTYPQFLTINNEMLLFYRNGVSGNANCYLNAYSTKEKRWIRRANLLDGISDNISPYLNNPTFNPLTNTIHITYMWRTSSIADSNNDLSYMKSNDNGYTWTNSKNEVFNLPLRRNNGEIILQTVDGNGMLNQAGCDVDENDNIHVVIFKTLNNKTQYLHVYNENGIFKQRLVSNNNFLLDMNVAVVDEETVTKPSVFCIKNRVFYINRSIENPNKLLLVEITPNEAIRKTSFVDINTGCYQFTYNTENLKNEKCLIGFMCQTTTSFNGNHSSNTNGANETFKNTIPILFNIDINYIDDFFNNKINKPKFELIRSFVEMKETNKTTSTSYVVLGGDAIPIIGNDNKFVYLRVLARLHNSVSSYTYVALTDQPSIGGSVKDYKLIFKNNNQISNLFETPIFKYHKSYTDTKNNYLIPYYKVDSGEANISIFMVEIYKLVNVN